MTKEYWSPREVQKGGNLHCLFHRFNFFVPFSFFLNPSILTLNDDILPNPTRSMHVYK